MRHNRSDFSTQRLTTVTLRQMKNNPYPASKRMHQSRDNSEKRSISKTVKMTESDYALFKEAAKAMWPENANPSDSELILTLAKICAKERLQQASSKKKKKR